MSDLFYYGWMIITQSCPEEIMKTNFKKNAFLFKRMIFKQADQSIIQKNKSLTT